jgi:virginiamycin B lyase
MRHSPQILVLVAVGLAFSAATSAQESIEILEWDVPWESTVPRDPYVGPDGKVWFVGQRGHYLAYLDRVTGEFTKFDLDEGTGPHNLIVDEDGMVFYAGNRVNHIGRLDPMSGEIHKFMMPDESARDPHTLVWNEDGDIWFTVQNGNFVGKLWKETGEVRLVAMPETQGRRPTSRPYGIKLDSSDQPWIVLFNTNMLATIDTGTFEVSTYDLPDERSRPRRMVIDSKDNVWWVDYALGRLGRFVPDTEEITEWDLPSGERSRPYAMEIAPDDRIWLVETGVQPNRFVGFDPDTEEFFSQTVVGSGGSTIRHMFYEAETNSIWFGADTNTVGQAKLPPLKRRIATDPQ